VGCNANKRRKKKVKYTISNVIVTVTYDIRIICIKIDVILYILYEISYVTITIALIIVYFTF